MKQKDNVLYEIDEKTPEKGDEHVIHLKNTIDTTFDENYQFLPKNKFIRFMRRLFLGFAIIVLSVISFFKHGLKITNKQVIKPLIKGNQGYVSVSNHNLVLDCCCAHKVNFSKCTYLPTVEETLEIPVIRKILPALNVLPIPTNPKGLVKFHKAVGELIQSGEVIHIYPEGALWPYYKELRPFKPGAFRFAVENKVPVVPFCIYFRPRKGLWKILGKKPLVTVEVLPPVYPDSSLAKKLAINKLSEQCYESMKVVIDSHFMETNSKEQAEQDQMKNMIEDMQNAISHAQAVDKKESEQASNVEQVSNTNSSSDKTEQNISTNTSTDIHNEESEQISHCVSSTEVSESQE